VSKNRSYQIADSSAISNPFAISESIDSIAKIDSLEEKVQTEANSSQKVSLPQVSIPETKALKEKDSLHYGIKNETSIPTRGYQPIKEILFTPTDKVNHIDFWQTLILLFCVILLGFTRAFNMNRFKQVTKSLFSYKTATEIVREEKVFFHRVNLLLSGVHILVISLFIYQLNFLLSSDYQSTSFLFYLKIVTLVLVIYSLKYIFSRILAIILDEQSLASQYIFSISSYNNLLGIVFIPVLFISSFTDLNPISILKYIALPLLFSIFALRLFRLIVIGSSKSISYVYIFLYICSLEILPLVVLVKIFIL